MVKRSSNATIIRLLVLLFIVMWIELVMVVKFFTEEYLLRYTIEKDPATAMFEHYKNVEEEKIDSIEVDDNLNESINARANINTQKFETSSDYDSPTATFNLDNLAGKEDSKEKSVSSRSGNIENSQIKFETEISNKIASIYQGYSTVGKIEIPKTNVNLYVLSEQTVGGMEIAACQLYSTGSLNQNGKTLIVGHNYRNGKLFSNNNKLNNGDTIKITTLDGTVRIYTIYNKIITTPEDVSFLLVNSESPEIVLSCCSDDNASRIVIMAR